MFTFVCITGGFALPIRICPMWLKLCYQLHVLRHIASALLLWLDKTTIPMLYATTFAIDVRLLDISKEIDRNEQAGRSLSSHSMSWQIVVESTYSAYRMCEKMP